MLSRNFWCSLFWQLWKTHMQGRGYHKKARLCNKQVQSSWQFYFKLSILFEQNITVQEKEIISRCCSRRTDCLIQSMLYYNMSLSQLSHIFPLIIKHKPDLIFVHNKWYKVGTSVATVTLRLNNHSKNLSLLNYVIFRPVFVWFVTGWIFLRSVSAKATKLY